VLQSVAMASGGEIFVLNMGQPVLIKELAEQVIRCAGREPHKEIKIEFTGLRPGEKLYEELLIGDHPEPTAHPRILRAQEAFLPWATLEPQLQALRSAAQANDDYAIRAVLAQCVQGFPAPGPV